MKDNIKVFVTIDDDGRVTGATSTSKKVTTILVSPTGEQIVKYVATGGVK